MQHKPKRKILSMLLVVCLLLEVLPVMALPVYAANVGTNTYEHTVTYTPATSLYTTVAHPSYVAKGGTEYASLQGFKLFDATTSVWGSVPEATRKDKGKTKTWLSNNNYLLNKFGCRNDSLYTIDLGKPFGKVTVYSTSPKIMRRTETKLFPGNLQVGFKEGSFHAAYNFEGLSWQDTEELSPFGENLYKDALANMNHEKTGNIGNMIEKGDIQYFAAFELDGYNHSCIFCDSYDTSILKIFDKQWKKQEYQAFNYSKASGPDFGIDKAWYPAKSLKTLYYSGDSGHDEKISAKLTNAILVGRDIAGPRLKSVKVTYDKEGKNEIPGGAITLDNIGSITDRTIYLQVIWNEPVIFKGLTNSELAKLSLKVQTLGIDGTSGMITEAPFLNFTPKNSDSTPMMTFEYRIPDPYTDNSAVTQERGYSYKFTKVAISTTENKDFWYNLQDLSGNKFAADKNGNQPSGKVEYAIDGSPFVDLEPFAIKNIRVTKDKAPNKEFVEQGELLSVTLELNKNLGYGTIGFYDLENYFYNGTNYQNFPTVMLNIKDERNEYVTIAPGSPMSDGSRLVKKVFNGSKWVDSSPKQHWVTPVKNQEGTNWPLTAVSINDYKKVSEGSGMKFYDVNKITYNVQLYPGYTLKEDTIKVTKVTPTADTKDGSGYKLMDYELDSSSGMLVPTNLPNVATSKAAQYKKATDKNYKLDFVPPKIEVDVSSDEGSGIIMVKADIIDDSLWGCDAAFDISVEGSVKGKIGYQSAADGTYNENNWVEAGEDSPRVGLSSPVVGDGNTRQAYAFIKLPTVSEVSRVTATVTVTDEARNSAGGEGKLPPADGSWSGFDNLPPVVSLTKDGEKAKVSITDMSEVDYSYEWQDTFEADGTTRKTAPSSYTGSVSGKKTDTISYTGTLPEGNMIHYKTLWVKAKDSADNESEAVSMDFAIDRTFAEIIIGEVSTGRLEAGKVPEANITLKNVSRYWYMWLEKPTDYIYRGGTEDDIDYGDAAAYVAGKGWGISGAHFNGWQPNDIDKKVEFDVPNQSAGSSSGFSLFSLSPDEETVSDAVYGDDNYGREYDTNENLDTDAMEDNDNHNPVEEEIEKDSNNGDIGNEGEETDTGLEDPKEDETEGVLYRGMFAGTMGSGDSYTNETVLDIVLDYENTQVVKYDRDFFGNNRDAKWELKPENMSQVPQTIHAKDSNRPLVLLIAVEDPNDDTPYGATSGNLRFASIEFDTFYNKPDIAVRQVRLSTNDGGGNRIDHERSPKGFIAVNEGLYWPTDKFYSWYNNNEEQLRIQQNQLMINATTLNDFAEAEFYLGADPATGLNRLPVDGLKIELRKELYRAKFKEEKDGDETTKLVFDYDSFDGIETMKDPIVMQDWIIDKDDLTKAQLFSDGYINNAIGSQRDFPYGSKPYRFTVKLDPTLVDAVPYEIHFDENNEAEPEVWYVRYGFYAVYDYDGDIDSPDELVSSFIFDNTPPSSRLRAITGDVKVANDPNFPYYNRGIDDMRVETKAVFNIDDNSFMDITTDIPSVTYSDGTVIKEDESNPGLSFEFYDNGFDLNGALPHTPSSYMPLLLAARDTEDSKVGSQPAVRCGKVEDLVIRDGRVRFKEKDWPEFFLIESDFVIPLNKSADVTLDEYESSLIYYQFYDKIRGTESPIYVINLKRDETPPVVELSISEPEKPVKEVNIKVEDPYDMHSVTVEGNTTYVIDTPSNEIEFEVNAWRKVDSGEEFNTTNKAKDNYYDEDEDFQKRYDENTQEYYIEYVRVKPNADGIYNFIRNGYICLVARDSAGNTTEDLIVNGVKADTPDEEWGIRYEVKNIDLDPPEFTEESVWTPYAAEGKFTLTAKADNTAVAAYVRFDKEYTEFITGGNYGKSESGETVAVTTPDQQPTMYALGEIPGQLEGGFDPETGEINATIYVKYGKKDNDEDLDKFLKSASLIIVDSAGNEAERSFDFTKVTTEGLAGIEPKITNTTTGIAKNVNNYPVYSYGESLGFSAPVMIDMYNTGFALEHENLPIYSDGPIPLGYIDLFGGTYVEYVYADIFGPGFSHSVKLYAGDEELDTGATVNKSITNKNVTLKIDTGGTDGLTINDQKQWETTVSQNGDVSYTLSSNTLGSKTFTLPISCIDKTVPEAYVNTVINSSIDEETGETAVYSITYEITGFSKRNVSVIDDAGNSAPLSITFDAGSMGKIHTFKFKDEAGNIGSYEVDVSDVDFSDPEDAKLAKYRLTYSGSGKDGANTLGIFTSGGDAFELGAVNSDIVVKAEALNAAGEPVPATMSLIGSAPSGVTVFTGQKTVLFTLEKETEQEVRVKLAVPSIGGIANSIEVPIIIPGGTIDKTPPKGTVSYVEDGGNIKAYLVPLCSDLADNGINVIGQKGDGIALKLEKDSVGYYVNFDSNGSGYFIMTDKAGNVGTVAIAVATIDNEPPKLGAEGWSGVIEAYSKANTWANDLVKILTTPTNNSIKVFFSFNEQLSKAEVTAYDNSEDLNEQKPTEEYVAAIVSGNSVTIEFKQNCQAKISVFDIRGNETVLWRPEDGPINIIDKIPPKLETGYPEEKFADNKVTITYKFANDEEVMLLSNPKDEYINEHKVEFTKNGQYILTFADKAGNILSQYPKVENIDELAPYVKIAMDFTGEGQEVTVQTGEDKTLYFTNKDVRILLNITDETPADLTVTASKQGGAEVPVTAGNVTIGGNSYTHHLTISENGIYEIKAKDKWGHENAVYANVTSIDRTPPAIAMASTKAIGTGKNADKDAVRTAILQGVIGTDGQSGVTAKDGQSGVTLAVANMDDIKLNTPGSYTAKITAKDRLGNTSEKTRTVNVLSGDLKIFTINGELVEANDIYMTTEDKIIVSTNHSTFKGEKINLYYTPGYKTTAQMKYTISFIGSDGFDISTKGYYTILAQSAERGMYMVYVYVY